MLECSLLAGKAVIEIYASSEMIDSPSMGAACACYALGLSALLAYHCSWWI